MILQKSEFRLVDRGFKEALVLIPGWATDYRIFSILDLDYNYLLPVKLNPFDFPKGLLRELNKIPAEKISLFGWSLGGFLAAEFALKFPEKINELFLLSVCRKFNPVSLDGIRQKIAKNRKAYLYKFYLDCFADEDTEGLGWFKENLMKYYLKDMELENLISGLDYFLRASINTASLAGLKKVRLFYGSRDKIVPYSAAEELKTEAGNIRFTCLSEIGHIPFLNPEFKEIFENG